MIYMYNTRIMNDIGLFKNKTLLITGGTGSFGEAVLKRFERNKNFKP